MILFGGADMHAAKTAKLKLLLAEIDQYPRDHVMQLDIDETVEYLWQKHRLEVPIIDFDKKVIVKQEPSANGVFITISIPFEGRREVLAIRPTMTQGGCPDADIGQSELKIKYHGSDARILATNIDQHRRVIEQHLKNAANDLKGFDTELQSRARLAIQQRRDKFYSENRIVEGIGIPILRREETPPTYPAPELRRKPLTASPPIAQKPSEPTVDLTEYDHILEIVSSMVKVMERSPLTFSHMEEESLRDNILVNLNGHYQGQATGETFNSSGKTDILVRAKDANIFIAECKIWRGPKAYLESIDQLLKYVTWRDTKTSIILFNRQKNFSAVLAQIPEVTKEHPNYKSTVEYNSDTAFRFIFRNANDPNKELWLTVVAFDVPA